jgi:hypothetical protein
MLWTAFASVFSLLLGDSRAVRRRAIDREPPAASR